MYRIDILLKQSQKLFHTQDLAILWQMYTPNTLYTTIKRYVARGILIPVQKGLYSTVPFDNLNPYVLGAVAMHTYTYTSCESVLVRHGVLFQAGEAITLVSSVSRRFTLAGHAFLVRKMANRFLHNDAGIRQSGGILTATFPRAVADMLYFHPSVHFDNPAAVNWQEVRVIQKEVGFL